VFVVDYGGTTIHEVLSDGRTTPIADGLSSPVGLVVTPDGANLLAATWGDGAIHRIPIPKR
jgi:sugar lactone lactonase YvrE